MDGRALCEVYPAEIRVGLNRRQAVEARLAQLVTGIFAASLDCIRRRQFKRLAEVRCDIGRGSCATDAFITSPTR